MSFWSDVKSAWQTAKLSLTASQSNPGIGLVSQAAIPRLPEGLPIAFDAAGQLQRRQANTLILIHPDGEVEERPIPTYDSDMLMVWAKTPQFMADPRFSAAYARGMDSGHHIMRPKGSRRDIHIEWRMAVTCWAGQQASLIPGDFVECGVNTGMVSLAVCDYVDFNRLNRDFWLFDTFAGLPEGQMSDQEQALGRLQHNAAFFSECYDIAKANFAPFPRAHLVRGIVPDSLATVSIDRVAYLHIDMNLALPEEAAIRHFWPKLSPGAPVVLDDYGWDGYHPQRQVMDGFAAEMGVPILLLPTGQGLLIKP